MTSCSTHEKLWAGWMVFTLSSQALLTGMVIYCNGSVDFGYKMFSVVSIFTSLVIFLMLHKALSTRLMSRGLMLWALTAPFIVALCHAAGLIRLLSLELIGIWWLGSCLLLGGTGLLLYRLFAWMDAETEGRVLVVGNYPEVRALLGRLAEQDIQPIGILGKAADYVDTDLAREWRGEEDDIQMTLAWYDVRSVYLAMPLCRFDDVCRLYRNVAIRYTNVYWAPDLGHLASLGPSVTAYNKELALIGFNLPPRIRKAVTIRIKAILEWIIAAHLVVLFLPLLLVIALAVRLSSAGPVLAREVRHGCDGRSIVIWKFRTLKLPCADGLMRTGPSTQRITPVGRFLRRTSLDELPQLFNVLQGRLALVGPRPYADAYNACYEERIALYRVRHRLKPGITGLAQVSGCRGETDCEDQMQRRVDHDLHYLRDWSLWMDLQIVLKTPFALFGEDA